MHNLSDKKILVITGKAGAGKDTLAQMVREEIYGTRPNNGLRDFKFSAPLKDAFCSIFGWTRTMIDNLGYKQARLGTPFMAYADEQCKELWTRREIMQYLGTDVFRKGDPTVWVDAALRKAAAEIPFVDAFVCTDCRFPNELKALRNNFMSVFAVDLVKVGGEKLDGKSADHASEQGPYGGEHYEEVTVKAGDFEHLRRTAEAIVNGFFADLREMNNRT